MIDYNFQIYKIFFYFSEKTNVNFIYLCLLAKKSQQQLRNLDETMKSVWNIRQIGNEEHSAINHLSAVLGISAELSKLLVIRNVKTFDEAKAFFRPSLDNLHDPFLMRDMSAAVERVNKALREQEKILVYGDYDVDGTTAVSLVYGFLKQYTKNICYYIPDRYTEGYGISFKGIEFAKDNGFSLVIALDCGIKSNDKIDLANRYGIDFIICDHHTPGVDLPKAVAVLDPHRADCEYPYEHLSGCGVGFKLVQALCMSNMLNIDEAFKYLDLAAVSIASDIVPITGENRVLASFGLRKLNFNPSAGLKSIKDVCGLNKKTVDISDIVFKIGPRINASGRLHSGAEAVQLLTSTNDEVLQQKCADIDGYNSERKDIDKSTTEEAKRQFAEQPDYKEKKSIVLYNPSWNKGIVGIVASRIAEEFCRPTIILTDSDDGLVAGSGRSVVGFDLYSAIDSCADLLVNFGGHPYAAGLTLRREQLTDFAIRFDNFVCRNILPEQLIPQIDIDTEIDFASITPKFIRILKQFAPFGPHNMKPVFCTHGLSDFHNQSRLIGKDNTHAKLVLTQNGHTFFDGVAFCSGYMRHYNMANIIDHIKNKGQIDICYTIEDNNFNGSITNQLMIRDIRIIC